MKNKVFSYIFENVWLYYYYKHYLKFSVSPFDILKDLNQSQYWPSKLIKQFQLDQLNKLVSFAKEHSEFYSNYYENSCKSELYNFHDFDLLPPITKNQIRENDLRTKNTNIKYIKEVTTSGSTGDPLRIYIDDLAFSYRIAGLMRFYSWWGINPADKGVMIWGKIKENGRPPNFIRRIYNSQIKRIRHISIFDLNSDSINNYFQMILKIGPSYIYGYTSAIKQFAELVKKRNLNGARLRLKIVIVTSEILLEEDRKFIEEILKCKVVNEYGAADAGLFAFECPMGGMHVFEESVYMTTNQNNEVISTEIFNRAMPMINYKVGDKVIFKNDGCKCGRTLRLIESIEGRTGDIILKTNGEELSQYFFYYMMKNLDSLGYNNGINKYKIIQKGSHFDFYIEKGIRFSNEIIDFILASMKNEIGNEIEVKFHFVEEIPREKGGKLRFFKREI